MNALVVTLLAGSISALLLGLGLGFKLGIPVGEQRGLEAAKFAKSFGVGQPDWNEVYSQQFQRMAGQTMGNLPSGSFGYSPNPLTINPLTTLGTGGAGGYNGGAGGYTSTTQYTSPALTTW